MNDVVISYFLNHIGYIDRSTVITFHHNLLFPAIPSDPHFQSLPGVSMHSLLSCYPSTSPIRYAYKQLKDILTWNVYVHQNTSYNSLHSGEVSATPFVGGDYQ